MNRIDSVLEDRLRLLDPSLSAGKPSDLYAEVIRSAAIQSDMDFEVFREKVTNALKDLYGEGWLLNPNINEEVLTRVLYAGLANDHKASLALSKDYWSKGNICKFITCESNEIPVGKTVYVRDDTNSDQTLKFISESVKTVDTVRIDFGDLSIEIDNTGRVLYPSHFFDNLFLEEQNHSDIDLPKDSIKGRAYIIEPSFEALKERRHFDLETLNTLRVDKVKNLLQFGEKVGRTNIEVASGFVLSFDDGQLVNAWLKVESTTGKSPKNI